MAHGSCARLAIRSRLSDCPSHRHVPYDLYIGITASTTTAVTGHCNFSLLSTQPITNSSYTDTHEQHNYGRHPSSCSSCQQKKPPVRQASRRETSIRPSSRSRDCPDSQTALAICPSTRLETGVGEEGCMKAAYVKSKPTLALLPSLRCEIECFKTKMRPRTPDRSPHDRELLRGTPADYCPVMFHEVEPQK